MKGFLKALCQRLVDSRWENWAEHMHESDRFSWYCAFKSSRFLEKYLSLDIDRHIKRTLTVFKFSVSDIAVHHNRYKGYSDNDLCPLCKDATEDELHVLFCCSALNDLREKFIPRKFYVNPCLFHASLLMASQNDNNYTPKCVFVSV